MKLLLYCTKRKPYLVYGDVFNGGSFIEKYCIIKGYSKQQVEEIWGSLNGKIIGECDYEVEEIKRINTVGDWFCYENQEEIMEKSKIDVNKFFDYLQGKNGYAIHIKNLHIFDEPKPLEMYAYCTKDNSPNNVKRGHQNMMYCYNGCDDYVLISIRPEWLCKILNGEKIIEVRRKVLKEMLK